MPYRLSSDQRPATRLGGLSGSVAPSTIRGLVAIVAVDDDGQVHFTILPGPVAKNRHLLGRTVA